MRMPTLFLGHGSPMNAIEDNVWARAWAALGQSLPRPRAVLCVSAHWVHAGCAVGAAVRPSTMHDFGGFPPALHAVRYAAPGSPALARRVARLLAPTPVRLDAERGLDHGVWSVLCHVFPRADVPVVQLALDANAAAADHYALGRRLRGLRDEGVLVLGSGNVVHNLRAFAWRQPAAGPLDWALRFETQVHEQVAAGAHAALIDYPGLGPDTARAVPTAEHYLPLLYVLGASHPDEVPDFPTRGVVAGSLSMLAVRFGGWPNEAAGGAP